MQAMDIGTYCTIYSKIYSAGQIFDSIYDVIHQVFEPRTFNQAQAHTCIVPSQRPSLPLQIPNQRCICLWQDSANFGQFAGKYCIVQRLSKASEKDSGPT